MGSGTLTGYNPGMGNGNDNIKDSGASVRVRPCLLCGQQHPPGSPCVAAEKRDGDATHGADSSQPASESVDGFYKLLNQQSAAKDVADKNAPTDENETAEPKPVHNSMVGSMIGGKYQMIEEIGQGGMSTVYKARQQPIDKIVAVKLLLAHLSRDGESVQRFFREAKSAGQISHPNVVSVFDFGITSDQQPYLVMDFLEGKNLEEILEKRIRLPYREAIPIFIEVCSGLAAAHECGIVHRDIKPSNIVVQELTGSQKVRIVDFGIAKMIDAEAQHLTKTGEVFGSPLYMSPEQCEGQPLDCRTDIYALGVVFYQVLCGRPPLVGQSALETMRKHMTEMPESLQKYADDEHIPLELENIVFKMMAKDRNKRYSSTMEIKHDLQRIIDGDSRVIASNLKYMSRELTRKSKILLASSITAVLLTSAGVLAYPSVCNELGKQKYASGMSKFSKDSKEAEALLESAVDLSRQAGDVGLESRSLASLIRIYRKDNSEKLDKARHRRQELIRKELEKLELGSLNMGEVLSSTDTEARLLEDKMTAGSFRSTRTENGNGPRAADSFGDGADLEASHEPGEMKKVSATRSRNASKRESIGAAYSDALIASNSSAEDQLASKESPRAFSPQPKRKMEMSSREDENYDSDELAPKSEPAAALQKAKPMRLQAAGGGGAGGGASGSLSGNALGFAAGQGSDLNVKVSDQRRQIAINSQAIDEYHVTYENLDRMEVLATLCVERGNYATAKESAIKGIAIYRQLNCAESDELAGLFTLQGLAAAKLQAWEELSSAIHEAEKLNELSPARQAEICSLKALLDLHLNNARKAKLEFDRALEITDNQTPSMVARKAQENYKQLLHL